MSAEYDLEELAKLEAISSRAARRGRRRRGRRGQAVVEFALVIPIFMLVLAAILDFGFMLFQRMTIINAAREGARAAVMVQTPSAASIDTAAWGAATSVASQGGVSITNSNVTITCVQTSASPSSTTVISCDSAKAEDSVVVTVSYTYHTFFPGFFGATFPLSSTVQMVID